MHPSGVHPRVLDLGFNPGITGSLPSAIGSFTSLSYLACYSTVRVVSLLSRGSVVRSMCGGARPESCVCLRCQGLSGAIPASIGQLTALTGLFLFDSYFTGSLPPLDGLRSLV
jgi:hypothetical protein